MISTLSWNVVGGKCNCGAISPCCWLSGLSRSKNSKDSLCVVSKSSCWVSSCCVDGAHHILLRFVHFQRLLLPPSEFGPLVHKLPSCVVSYFSCNQKLLHKSVFRDINLFLHVAMVCTVVNIHISNSQGQVFVYNSQIVLFCFSSFCIIFCCCSSG